MNYVTLCMQHLHHTNMMGFMYITNMFSYGTCIKFTQSFIFHDHFPV